VTFTRDELAQNQDESVIYIENVSVRYRVPAEHFVTFKDFAIQWMKGKVKHRDFWALRDISLEVPRGQVFGVIGKNGAGKSTLLKLIARVLRPQQGRVRVRGKVAPLLELGAGFHPELSGRENIFLNGAILGFSHQEMEAKYDSIVEFSELSQFIDSPIRTYSSGMWARLGFAVATAEQPDILLVDEILSVGDESFQMKCLDRILDYRDKGTTIFLVAHAMNLIETFCEQVALLDHGKLVCVSEPKEVVEMYRSSQAA
jgi:ABC-2 type transport system ATP-binding protein